ncbi:hypothetical protein GB931_04795 [Modestobacter sp. I12A-02628]|uniref:Uncharacterized protein n=1 Tax=Goekera deserti TaxID=2497753 RepID=A0A7K3WHF3_9ACTN|nr:hypothetical protein [Goekera deserti]MPQ97255.1 hypothetical protein [Goekera deserti]NDI50234.1 hypothetical protein [Goekera deserti]NEL55802.1 hypothetical protein [Goekera deserti]
MRPAIVLGTTEECCTVVVDGQQVEVRYSLPFPSPRVERVSPGHLVALAVAPDGAEVVVWRWYDAVVLGEGEGVVRLWEPAHGVVVARLRDPRQAPRPGSRVYLSAGLPGAEWWAAGPAVDRAEQAVVELDVVRRFLLDHGLWERLV